MDSVFIAPKRKEVQANTSGKSSSFRSKRESMVYTGPTAKKAHLVDPFHALNRIPINKTLQRKLEAMKKATLAVDRQLMYADYWSSIEEEMQYYAVSPISIISLPAAPLPTHENDGKPHILKYGEKGVASKRIDASHVHKHFDSQHLSLQAKLKLKETQAKQQKLLKKEVKLHDIPGFNLFQQSDCEEYDFYLWAEKVAMWSKEVTQWFHTQETAWRKHNRMQSLTYLLRLQYLSEESATDSSTVRELPGSQAGAAHVKIKAANRLVRMQMLAAKQRLANAATHKPFAKQTDNTANDAEMLRKEQNSLFLLRHLDQADTLDVFELLLCKSNIGLKVKFTNMHLIIFCVSFF
jgi:hypothetical protein